MTGTQLAFMSPGFLELLVIGVIALLVYGGDLPEVMRNLGRSYAKFRRSLHEFSQPVRDELSEIHRVPSTELRAPLEEALEEAKKDPTESAPPEPLSGEYETPDVTPEPEDEDDALDEPPPV